MSPARRVVIFGTLLIVVMASLTVAVAIRRHGAELTDAARELRTLDVLLAEEAGRSLQSVALVLDSVVDQVGADNAAATPEDFVSRESTKAIYDMLRARVAGIQQLDAVTIISAQGKLINFSRSWPVPDLDLSDRDYFRYLRDHRTDEPYLSEPVVNRGSGTPTIYLARRISAPDGRFVGLVLGAIALNSFEHLYASLELEPGDFVALWRRDGVLLARHPPASVGQRMPPEAITSPDAAFRGVAGVFEKRWTLGGDPEARVVASQAAEGFPLQVNIGRSEPVILADWRREVTGIGSAVTFAILCIAALMWALLRRFRAYEAVAALSQERERAIEARQRAEDTLRQSQKMEAVGQLTGGVAHDFNNLLTVMRSSVDLLRRPNLAEDRRTRYVDAIADATERAAKLTGQLLAFSRKQALNPELFDVAADVTAIADLVSRLTGSRVHVVTTFATESCFVHADPNQFDTAIVNMAVNGRDAMPDGGTLTIDVRAAAAIPEVRSSPAVEGAYVAVSVSDSGVGMTPDTLDRIFEPFFTTKKVGEGTGLGLSQVFGFAKQSGGEVTVDSVPGRGTTFTLYLPRVEASTAVRPDAKTVSEQARPGGRVLVVEDNQEVGRTTVETLHELGFATVWADSAEQALRELEAGRERFDLVFSDVVMPGMTGIELGHTIAQRFSGLPVVLTSGYSQDLAEQGLHGFTLLRKPYRLDDLARVLSHAMPQVGVEG